MAEYSSVLNWSKVEVFGYLSVPISAQPWFGESIYYDVQNESLVRNRFFKFIRSNHELFNTG